MVCFSVHECTFFRKGCLQWIVFLINRFSSTTIDFLRTIFPLSVSSMWAFNVANKNEFVCSEKNFCIVLFLTFFFFFLFVLCQEIATRRWSGVLHWGPMDRFLGICELGWGKELFSLFYFMHLFSHTFTRLFGRKKLRTPDTEGFNMEVSHSSVPIHK